MVRPGQYIPGRGRQNVHVVIESLVPRPLPERRALAEARRALALPDLPELARRGSGKG